MVNLIDSGRLLLSFWLASLTSQERIMWGEARLGKKVCVNWKTFTHQLIMMGEVGVCLAVEVREGRIGFVYEVQYIILECERAELSK
jgi:hypothetical protein